MLEPVRLSLPMNFRHLLVRRASLAVPEKRQLLQVSGQAFGRYDFERAIPTPSLASCHFDRSGEISFYFELWRAITVSGDIGDQVVGE